MSPKTKPPFDSHRFDADPSLGELIVQGAIQLAWLDGLSEAEICKQMRLPRKHISALITKRPHAGLNENLEPVDA